MMKTIFEIKELLGIEFEEKLHRNYIKKVYIHNSKVTMSKQTRMASVSCHVTYKIDDEKIHSQYVTGSRTEEFLMNVLDCYLNRVKEPKLSVENREVYRMFLMNRISFTELQNYKYLSVTH